MGTTCCKCSKGDANTKVGGTSQSSGSSTYAPRKRAKGSRQLVGERYRLGENNNSVHLTLESITRDDEGEYTVTAKNIAGESRSAVYLKIKDGSFDEDDTPIFLRRLNDLAVKVGTRTRFLVEIRSSSDIKVTWQRNDIIITEEERFHFLHEGNFFCVDVAPVTVEDGGRWACVAENRTGRSSCSCRLNVLVPKAYKAPEFLEELKAMLTDQGTVSLECKVVGVPTPILKWYKDGKEIKPGDMFALTANPADPTSLGMYTCEATNCMGKVYSSSRVHLSGKTSREGSLHPADHHFAVGPPPLFSKELKSERTKVGTAAALACQVKVPPWPKTINWYNKEGKVEQSEKYHFMEDGLGGYSLEIYPLDASDEGEWKCVATSDTGVISISKCILSMIYPKNYRKPKFLESLKAILTEEGLVSFECKVVGFPTPQLQWFKDGQELRPGDVYQLTGTNSLGSYSCIARNCMGEARSTAELTVEDIQSQLNEEERLHLFSKNQPPRFIRGLKSCEAKINEDIRFTVQVTFSPGLVLSWYRDDERIEDNGRYSIVKENAGVCHLDVKKLEVRDQTEWKCLASNEFGQSITTGFLRLTIPKHYKKPKFLECLRAILSEAGAVNLECKVIGVPQPELKWYKDGKELKAGDIHKIISGEDGKCCLGTYTCEARNCMGTVSSSASLLGFEDCKAIKEVPRYVPEPLYPLVKNTSLSTINEERTSQLYDTAGTENSMTIDERGDVSFSFDGKEVSISLYETPDLTEEEALQVVEMYAEELSEHISEQNVVELPPMRFTKESSKSGPLLMEAVVIDVSEDYFSTMEDDLRTEADFEDVSMAEEGLHNLASSEIENEAFFEKINTDFLEKALGSLSSKEQQVLKKEPKDKSSDSKDRSDSFKSLSSPKRSSMKDSQEDATVADGILSESKVDTFISARDSSGTKARDNENFMSGKEDEKRKKSRSRSSSADKINRSFDEKVEEGVVTVTPKRASVSRSSSGGSDDKSISKSVIKERSGSLKKESDEIVQKIKPSSRSASESVDETVVDSLKSRKLSRSKSQSAESEVTETPRTTKRKNQSSQVHVTERSKTSEIRKSLSRSSSIEYDAERGEIKRIALKSMLESADGQGKETKNKLKSDKKTDGSEMPKKKQMRSRSSSADRAQGDNKERRKSLEKIKKKLSADDEKETDKAKSDRVISAMKVKIEDSLTEIQNTLMIIYEQVIEKNEAVLLFHPEGESIDKLFEELKKGFDVMMEQIKLEGVFVMMEPILQEIVRILQDFKTGLKLTSDQKRPKDGWEMLPLVAKQVQNQIKCAEAKVSAKSLVSKMTAIVNLTESISNFTIKTKFSQQAESSNPVELLRNLAQPVQELKEAIETAKQEGIQSTEVLSSFSEPMKNLNTALIMIEQRARMEADDEESVSEKILKKISGPVTEINLGLTVIAGQTEMEDQKLQAESTEFLETLSHPIQELHRGLAEVVQEVLFHPPKAQPEEQQIPILQSIAHSIAEILDSLMKKRVNELPGIEQRRIIFSSLENPLSKLHEAVIVLNEVLEPEVMRYMTDDVRSNVLEVIFRPLKDLEHCLCGIELNLNQIPSEIGIQVNKENILQIVKDIEKGVSDVTKDEIPMLESFNSLLAGLLNLQANLSEEQKVRHHLSKSSSNLSKSLEIVRQSSEDEKAVTEETKINLSLLRPLEKPLQDLEESFGILEQHILFRENIPENEKPIMKERLQFLLEILSQSFEVFQEKWVTIEANKEGNATLLEANALLELINELKNGIQIIEDQIIVLEALSATTKDVIKFNVCSDLEKLKTSIAQVENLIVQEAMEVIPKFKSLKSNISELRDGLVKLEEQLPQSKYLIEKITQPIIDLQDNLENVKYDEITDSNKSMMDEIIEKSLKVFKSQMSKAEVSVAFEVNVDDQILASFKELKNNVEKQIMDEALCEASPPVTKFLEKFFKEIQAVTIEKITDLKPIKADTLTEVIALTEKNIASVSTPPQILQSEVTESLKEALTILHAKLEEIKISGNEMADQSSIIILQNLVKPLTGLQKRLEEIANEPPKTMKGLDATEAVTVLASPITQIQKGIATIQQQTALRLDDDGMPEHTYPKVLEILMEPFRDLQIRLTQTQKKIMEIKQHKVLQEIFNLQEEVDKLNIKDLKSEMVRALTYLQESLENGENILKAVTELNNQLEKTTTTEKSTLMGLRSQLERVEQELKTADIKLTIPKKKTKNETVSSLVGALKKLQDGLENSVEIFKNERSDLKSLISPIYELKKALTKVDTVKDLIACEEISKLLTNLLHSLQQFEKQVGDVVASDSFRALSKPVNEIKENIAAIEKIIRKEENTENLTKLDTLMMALASELHHLQEAVQVADEKLSSEAISLKHDKSMSKDIVEPMQELELKLAEIKQHTKLENVGEFEASIIETFAKPMQQLRTAIAMIEEQEFETNILSPPIMHEQISQPIMQLHKGLEQIQQLMLQSESEVNKEILKSVAKPIQELFGKIAIIQEQMTDESDVMTISSKTDISALQALVKPTDDIQKILAVVHQCKVMETESESTSSLQAITMGKPLQELRYGLEELRNTILEATSIAECIPSLEVVAKPVHQLEHFIAITQSHEHSTDEGTIPMEDFEIVQKLAAPIHELSSALLVVKQQLIESGLITFSENIIEPSKLLMTFIKPAEIEKILAIVEEYQVMEPEAEAMSSAEESTLAKSLQSLHHELKQLQNVILEASTSVECISALKAVAQPVRELEKFIAVKQEYENVGYETVENNKESEVLSKLATPIQLLTSGLIVTEQQLIETALKTFSEELKMAKVDSTKTVTPLEKLVVEEQLMFDAEGSTLSQLTNLEEATLRSTTLKEMLALQVEEATHVETLKTLEISDIHGETMVTDDQKSQTETANVEVQQIFKKREEKVPHDKQSQVEVKVEEKLSFTNQLREKLESMTSEEHRKLFPEAKDSSLTSENTNIIDSENMGTLLEVDNLHKYEDESIREIDECILSEGQIQVEALKKMEIFSTRLSEKDILTTEKAYIEKKRQSKDSSTSEKKEMQPQIEAQNEEIKSSVEECQGKNTQEKIVKEKTEGKSAKADKSEKEKLSEKQFEKSDKQAKQIMMVEGGIEKPEEDTVDREKQSGGAKNEKEEIKKEEKITMIIKQKEVEKTQEEIKKVSPEENYVKIKTEEKEEMKKNIEKVEKKKIEEDYNTMQEVEDKIHEIEINKKKEQEEKLKLKNEVETKKEKEKEEVEKTRKNKELNIEKKVEDMTKEENIKIMEKENVEMMRIEDEKTKKKKEEELKNQKDGETKEIKKKKEDETKSEKTVEGKMKKEDSKEDKKETAKKKEGKEIKSKAKDQPVKKEEEEKKKKKEEEEAKKREEEKKKKEEEEAKKREEEKKKKEEEEARKREEEKKKKEEEETKKREEEKKKKEEEETKKREEEKKKKEEEEAKKREEEKKKKEEEEAKKREEEKKKKEEEETKKREEEKKKKEEEEAKKREEEKKKKEEEETKKREEEKKKKEEEEAKKREEQKKKKEEEEAKKREEEKKKKEEEEAKKREEEKKKKEEEEAKKREEQKKKKEEEVKKREEQKKKKEEEEAKKREEQKKKKEEEEVKKRDEEEKLAMKKEEEALELKKEDENKKKKEKKKNEKKQEAKEREQVVVAKIKEETKSAKKIAEEEANRKTKEEKPKSEKEKEEMKKEEEALKLMKEIEAEMEKEENVQKKKEEEETTEKQKEKETEANKKDETMAKKNEKVEKKGKEEKIEIKQHEGEELKLTKGKGKQERELRDDKNRKENMIEEDFKRTVSQETTKKMISEESSKCIQEYGKDKDVNVRKQNLNEEAKSKRDVKRSTSRDENLEEVVGRKKVEKFSISMPLDTTCEEENEAYSRAKLEIGKPSQISYNLATEKRTRGISSIRGDLPSIRDESAERVKKVEFESSIDDFEREIKISVIEKKLHSKEIDRKLRFELDALSKIRDRYKPKRSLASSIVEAHWPIQSRFIYGRSMFDVSGNYDYQRNSSGVKRKDIKGSLPKDCSTSLDDLSLKNLSASEYCGRRVKEIPREKKGRPVFCSRLIDRTAPQGSHVKLTCTALGNPEPSVKWLRDGLPLIIKQGERYRTKIQDGVASLEIEGATKLDNGEYTCLAENIHGETTTSCSLRIFDSYEPAPFPPTFATTLKESYKFTEDELILQCRVRSHPPAKVHWLRNGVPIRPSNRYQQTESTDGMCRLVIFNPEIDDSGEYICRAENPIAEESISHRVKFPGRQHYVDARKPGARSPKDFRKPHFRSELTDHLVPAGGTIALQVEVRGMPIPEVKWLRGNEELPRSSSRVRSFEEAGVHTLLVSNASEKEAGIYSCHAYNAFGHIRTTAAVEVLPLTTARSGKPPKIINRPKDIKIVSVEDDVIITCRVTGDPKPRITWLKGTKDITVTHRTMVDHTDDYYRFILKKAVPADAGTYWIIAKNVHGHDRAFVTVQVKQRARSLTPGGFSSSRWDWGASSKDSLEILSEIHDREKYSKRETPGPIASEPYVADSGRNWLTLSWNKPTVRGAAPVIAYRVDAWEIGQDGGARWTELGVSPVNTFDAFNLKHGKEYKFRITPRNRYGWGEPLITSRPISVGYEQINMPEFTKILPGQLKALFGSSIRLECEVASDIHPQISWYKDGVPVDFESPRIFSACCGSKCQLIITDLIEEDSGRYMCQAVNKMGRASTFARLMVVSDSKVWEADANLKRGMFDEDGIPPDSPPQFTMRLRDRRVQMTYPVRLTCQVIGLPEPDVMWCHDGKELSQDDHHVFSSEDNFHTLEISKTTLEDAGCYTATARNEHGSVSCRCNLVVDKGIRAYVAPEFVKELEVTKVIKIGDELRLMAQVEAYPSIGVVWHKNGIRIRPSRRISMTLSHDGNVELTRAKVTERDSGVYTCTATNEVGRCETICRVNVQPQSLDVNTIPRLQDPSLPYSKAPLFIKKPRSNEAVEGDTVIIECQVVGDPKPEVFWLRDFLKPDYYRDSPHFRREGEGPDYSLEIPNVKLDHTGTYSVVARNVHGEVKAVLSLQIYAKGQGKEDSMDHNPVTHGKVETLPTIKKGLKDIRCCDGDAVTFECVVEATTSPDIRWKKSGKLVPMGGDFSTEFDGQIAKLTINQVYPEDEGEYTCEASNALGKTVTSACLVVDVPEEKENLLSRQLTRPPNLMSGCSTPRSTPRTTPSRSISPYPTGYRFRSTSPCHRPRRLKLAPPKFYAVPHNRIAQEGETVRFQCAVAGHPAPWVKWDKDGLMVTPTARITITEKDDLKILEITEVMIEDAGLYRIAVENEVGRIEATARLDVIGPHTHKSKVNSVRAWSASPTFRRRLVRSIGRVGGNMTLGCDIRSSPNPVISWYRNSELIVKTKRITPTWNGEIAMLDIENLEREDAGVYTCVAENDFGRSQCSAEMVVVDENCDVQLAPVFVEPLNDAVAEEGKPTELQVLIKGSGQLEVVWTKGNKEIPDCNDFRYVDYGDGRFGLRLADAFTEDSGEYACEVFNQYGEASSSASLLVKENVSSTTPKMALSKKPTSVVVACGRGANFCFRHQCSDAEDPPVVSSLVKKQKIPTNSSGTCSIEENGDVSIPRVATADRSDAGQITCIASHECSHRDSLTEKCSCRATPVSVLTDTRPSDGECDEIKCRGMRLRSSSSDKIEADSQKMSRDSTGQPEYPVAKKDDTRALILRGPEDTNVFRGGRVVLKATYCGQPEPQVRWMKGGRLLKNDDRIRISSENGETNLTIDSISSDDSGKYVVCVENGHGSDCHFASLAVEGPPEPPSGHPIANGLTPDATEVEWSCPAFDGGCKITGYVIEMKSESEPEWKVVSVVSDSFSCIVKNLRESEKYKFRIRAENCHGRSEPSMESNELVLQKMENELPPQFEPRTVTVENGDLFKARYEVLEELGKGRYGVVHKVSDLETGQKLAAKFIRCITVKDREKVKEEIDIMNCLRHPKLLQLAAAFEGPREIVMVMEYISGGELFERVVADDFQLTERDCILFMRQICEGVRYMHETSVVHLDLKPENIMCQTRTSHEIKLIDFGLAQKIDPEVPVRVLFGTPEFVPPEVINYEPIGFESDMWSVGVICYVLLSGLSPFMGENDAETFANITRASYDFDDEAFCAISQDAKDFISSLLVKRKEKRLTASECLRNKWMLSEHDKTMGVVISTDKLKKFIIRRKWQKTGNALRALGRLATLSAASRKNPGSVGCITCSSLCGKTPSNQAEEESERRMDACGNTSSPLTYKSVLNTVPQKSFVSDKVKAIGKIDEKDEIRSRLFSERSDSGISDCSSSSIGHNHSCHCSATMTPLLRKKFSIIETVESCEAPEEDLHESIANKFVSSRLSSNIIGSKVDDLRKKFANLSKNIDEMDKKLENVSKELVDIGPGKLAKTNRPPEFNRVPSLKDSKRPSLMQPTASSQAKINSQKSPVPNRAQKESAGGLTVPLSPDLRTAKLLKMRQTIGEFESGKLNSSVSPTVKRKKPEGLSKPKTPILGKRIETTKANSNHVSFPPTKKEDSPKTSSKSDATKDLNVPGKENTNLRAGSLNFQKAVAFWKSIS